MKYVIIICLCLACVSLSAQGVDPENTGSGPKYVTDQLPKEWSIKNQVKTIERSLNNYDPLIQSLEEANNDLKLDLAEYLRNPGDQVLAAKITAKMSGYAKKIVSDVDKITSDQDNLLAVFNEVNRKLNKFSNYLDFKAKELDSKVQNYEVKHQNLRKKLKELARKAKNADDPKEQSKAKNEFRRLFRDYNLNIRYKDGFARHRKEYQTLSKNLNGLTKIFGILKEAFASLIDNLSAEKKYLLDNIRLQADAIRVQKLVNEGISDGSRAVVKITKKLALVYAKVEGFAKVHEKINRDMAKFTDTTKILNSLVVEIDKTPFKSAPSIDKAIEYFANAPD